MSEEQNTENIPQEPAFRGGQDESIGMLLKRSREQKGLTLDQMAELTKLRTRYLQALEEDNYDVLPNKIAARGFLKIYADRLGMDVRGVTSRFDEKFPQPEASANTIQRSTEKKFSITPEPSRISKVGNPLFATPIRSTSSHQTFLTFITKQYRHYFYYGLIGVGLLLLVMYSTSLFLRDINRSPSGRAPVGDIRSMAATPEQLSLQQQGFMGVVVVVRPQGNTWLRTYVDGFLNFKGPVERGLVKEFRGRNYIRIKVGDGSLVDLLVNGEHVGRLSSGNVIVDKRFYPLAPEISASLNAADYREPVEIVTQQLNKDEGSVTLNSAPPEGEVPWDEQMRRGQELKRQEEEKLKQKQAAPEGW
jgi:cytoskeleton protein RodZ